MRIYNILFFSIIITILLSYIITIIFDWNYFYMFHPMQKLKNKTLKKEELDTKVIHAVYLLSTAIIIAALAIFLYYHPLDDIHTIQSANSNNVENNGNNNDTNRLIATSTNAELNSAAIENTKSEENGIVPENKKNTKSKGIGGGNIVGDSHAGKKDLPIYCVKTDEKKVALSFDAAWGADDTLNILNTLDKYNVKVTFFMTGGWVKEYPDMVKEIYARGHDLGNHSENHKQMSKLSKEEQIQEISSVDAKIKEITGYDCFLFRPPYGDYNSELIKTTYGINHYPIQWDVDSLDWKDYGVSNIIKTVTQHKALGNGSIVLMHNGAKYTAEALETVITSLQEQGYTLVPISQLIVKENFHMDGTGRQIADLN